MSAFSEDWLALRETVDHSARDASLLVHLGSSLDTRTRQRQSKECQHIVDLGTGTGSNLRYLLPRLGATQQWQLIDNDPLLLDVLPGRMHSWGARHELLVQVHPDRMTVEGKNLRADMTAQYLNLATDMPLLHSVDLLTSSALLDLFSANRITAIAEAAGADQIPCLFALNYDGRLRCAPEHEDDQLIFDLFNEHQHRDKGLGVALGPQGGAAMARALRDIGHAVIVSRADWQLDKTTKLLQTRLMDGWCEAAIEQSPADTNRIKAWRECRQRDCETGNLHITVGHVDVLGMPLSPD